MRPPSNSALLLMVAFVATGAASTKPWAHDSETGKSATPPYAAKDPSWSLRLQNQDNVAFKGMVNFDGAGVGTAQMLYPAPNAAGLLASVITHGLILERARSEQKKKIQEAADQVLIPYQRVLGAYKYRDLMQLALDKTTTGGNKRLVEPSESHVAGLLVETSPIFWMTQDQTAIVVDNAVSIYAPGKLSTATYQNIIRVVSPAETRTDLVSFWTTAEGSAIKNTSANLFAESVDLALAEITRETEQNQPYRTVRYFEGTTERMERGQVVKEHCDRVILRNLRGWIMSVPVKPTTTASVNACDKITPK